MRPDEIITADPTSLDSHLGGEGLTVVYFWGHDCPNCEVFAADLPGLLERVPPSVRVVKVNAYEHPALATRFGLFGIPAFVLFRGGKKLGMMRQYHGREYWSRVIAEQAAAQAEAASADAK